MNKVPTIQEITALNKKYPKGTRIKLIEMRQDAHPVPSGTMGTVVGVDDLGTIHVSWDNHSSLGIVENIDEFEIIKED